MTKFYRPLLPEIRHRPGPQQVYAQAPSVSVLIKSEAQIRVSAPFRGLLVWLSAGLAFAGLARCVLVLEARRGRLDLTTYHGGYERMPVLAISFLSMGLACTGFPGTLGFVGQELLVDGAVDAFPVMGFAVVIASALTGLAVLRMYFSLSCGHSDALAHSGLRLGLTPREAGTFVALVIALVGFGVAPRPLVDSRFAASNGILQLRQMRTLGGHASVLVTPDTILRWHRQLIARKWTRERRQVGRPEAGREIHRLSVRMVQENPTWGYRRILRALRNLAHRAARSTIATILRTHGIGPVPERPMSWRTFLAAH